MSIWRHFNGHLLVKWVENLAQKSVGLMQNRSKEIEDLTSNINTYFQQIKSIDVGDNRKSHVWFQILTAVLDIMNYSAEQAILSAVQFWTMDRRKELISKEHEHTFEGILTE